MFELVRLSDMNRVAICQLRQYPLQLGDLPSGRLKVPWVSVLLVRLDAAADTSRLVQCCPELLLRGGHVVTSCFKKPRPPND